MIQIEIYESWNGNCIRIGCYQKLKCLKQADFLKKLKRLLMLKI